MTYDGLPKQYHTFTVWKTPIWLNQATSGHQNRRLRNVGGGETPVLGDLWKFVSKIMHRHISAKI